MILAQGTCEVIVKMLGRSSKVLMGPEDPLPKQQVLVRDAGMKPPPTDLSLDSLSVLLIWQLASPTKGQVKTILSFVS